MEGVKEEAVETIQRKSELNGKVHWRHGETFVDKTKVYEEEETVNGRLGTIERLFPVA